MATKTIFVCIKVQVEIAEPLPKDIESNEEALDQFVQQMDYNLAYDNGPVNILNTEVVGYQDHAPIGLTT